MARMWLLALLVLAAAAAAGMLLVKYQLERLRGSIYAEIQARTGLLIRVERLEVHGLTGIRLDQLHVEVDTKSGPRADLFVPRAFLHVSLIELIQGRIALDRLELDHARIRLARPPENAWLASDVALPSGLGGGASFRVVGEDCTLEIAGAVGNSRLEIGGLDFDLNRLSGSPHIIANITGRLGGDEGQEFAVFARYATLEDFDLRFQSDGLSPSDIAVFFPQATDILAAGRLAPSIRLSGYPRRAMVVALELPFKGLEFQDAATYPVPPEGVLTGLASYDLASRLFTLNSARTIAPEFEGRVEGTIDMAQPLPEFDLRLEVQQLPVARVMEMVSGKWLAEYGSLEIETPEPYKFFVTLRGNAEEPRVGVEVQMAHGGLRFAPAVAANPSADLKFSLLSLSWDSDAEFPRGSLALAGGAVRHPATAIVAENLSGNLAFSGDGIVIDPVVAQVAGNTIMGSLRYDLARKAVKFDLSGTIGALEELAFVKDNPALALYGAASIERMSGNYVPGTLTLDATVDLTRAGIEWEWWIAKAPGIGARLEDVRAEIATGKSASLAFSAAIDTTEIAAEISFARRSDKWLPLEAAASSSKVSMATANKLLNIPYAIGGGTGTGATLQWTRLPGDAGNSEMRIGGHIDDLTLQPAGLRERISGKDVRVDTIIRKRGGERTGELALDVASADLPPVGSPWMLPLREDDDPSMDRFPALDRRWTYTLKADELTYPPWEGAEFTGAAFQHDGESGFESFSAQVDGGNIGGMYSLAKPENLQESDFHWERVPARFLLDHLKLPPVFTGTVTGGIKYIIDRDDRGTLRGNGYFDVADGQFSADFLFAQFARQLEGGAITLPPSLKFEHFTSEVELQGDVVRTNNMRLVSDAVTINGEGRFVVDGDIDYHLRIELPPATAQGIPALRTYFNLDGLRHSQNNLKLAFRVHGSRHNPTVALDGMPSVGDTILSGAVEVTADVMKVVDLPRQILLDLFKIGGGIVGAGGKRSAGE